MTLRVLVAVVGITVIILGVVAVVGRDTSDPHLRDYLLSENDLGGDWSERLNIWEAANVERDCGEDSVVEHASITFDQEAEGRLVAHALTVWQDGQCAWDILQRTEPYQFEPAIARPLSEVAGALGADSMVWRIEEPDRGTVYDFIISRRGDMTSATWREARTALDLHETVRLAEAASDRLESAERQFRDTE